MVSAAVTFTLQFVFYVKLIHQDFILHIAQVIKLIAFSLYLLFVILFDVCTVEEYEKLRILYHLYRRYVLEGTPII